MSLVTFEQARANPELRQAYLDSVDFEEHAEYVGRRVYLHTKHRRNPGVLMSCAPHITSLGGMKHKKSTIFVYMYSFNADNEQDLFSDLIDHEGRHAWQNSETPRSLTENFRLTMARLRNMDLLYTSLQYDREIDAIEFQLAKINAGLRNVSRAHKEDVENCLKDIRERQERLIR